MTVRITNSIIQNATMAQLQANQRAIYDAQQQVMSGLRVRRMSDDPVAANAVMRTDSTLRALEQYNRNIEMARTRLDMEESVLDQLDGILSRARELAVAQGTQSASRETRQVAAQELKQLVGTARQLVRTRFEGAYIFGGSQTDRCPLETQPSPQGTMPLVEVGAGQLVRLNHTADQVFFTAETRQEGAIPALEELVQALESNDVEGIQDALPELTAAHNNVQDLFGDLGARANMLSLAATRIEEQQINLQTFKSDAQDVELEKAISELVNRQAALEAALMANSRVLQTTLADYLR